MSLPYVDLWLKRITKNVSQKLKFTIFKSFVLMLMFIGLFRKREIEPTAIIFSLSYEQVFHNSTPKSVISFFNEDRFTSRVDLSKPIIEVRNLKTILSNHQEVTYDAVIYLLTAVLMKKDYVSIYTCIKDEIARLDKNQSFSIRDLKRVIVDKCVYTHYLSCNLSKTTFITTQSSLSTVPLLFKLAQENRKIMIWYSTNSKPIYAVSDLNREKIDTRNIKAYIDEHWVWDEGDLRFLESEGIQNASALGAMFFQEKKFANRSNVKFLLTYFDVTPFDGADGLYSEKNTLAVLDYLMTLAKALDECHPGKFELRIKPKRKYSKAHSKRYISKIHELSKNEFVKLISPVSNLYQVVTESDFVLAVPFSSPAVLAKQLGVKSAFIATGMAGWDIPVESNQIAVEFQIDSLIEKMKSDMKDKFNL